MQGRHRWSRHLQDRVLDHQVHPSPRRVNTAYMITYYTNLYIYYLLTHSLTQLTDRFLTLVKEIKAGLKVNTNLNKERLKCRPLTYLFIFHILVNV